MNTNRLFYFLLFIFSLILFLSWDFLPSSDNLEYFKFADQRMFLGVPNFMDVFSNIGFILAGSLGLKYSLSNQSQKKTEILLSSSYSLAIFLTGFGSSYFHWHPTPDTLVWDRLPMTIGFSSLLALLFFDRISEKTGLVTFIILLPLGLFSIVGNHLDLITLRTYFALQFSAILWVILMGTAFKAQKIGSMTLFKTVGWYVLAKIFEVYDLWIYQASEFVSGHSLKHFAATIAVFEIIKSFQAKPRGF